MKKTCLFCVLPSLLYGKVTGHHTFKINPTYNKTKNKGVFMDTFNNCNCAPPRPPRPPGPPPPPPPSDVVTQGRIVDIDRRSRSFTTVSNLRPSSLIRFNLARNARILNSFGRPIEFSQLVPGLQVRVRHSAVMTASIPPQSTAFEVRVLR